MAECIGSIFAKEKIRIARIGPMLGVHFGPGALVVVLREKTTA